MSEQNWPQLAMDGRQFGGRDYDELGFDRAFFETLADWVGCSKDENTIVALREEHYFAVQLYFKQKATHEAQVERAKEEKALEHLKRCVAALSFALDDLEESGLALPKLLHSVDTHPAHLGNPDTYPLTGLFGHARYRPFDGIEDILMHLSVAAERAIARKPEDLPKGPTIPNAEISREEIRERITRHLASKSHGSNPEETYKELKRDWRTPKDFPLAVFTKQFQILWERFSPHLFTGGHNYGGPTSFNSNPVLAIEYCLKVQRTPHTRSSIGNAIQKIRTGVYDIEVL
jgi:hypothetical protein